MINSQPVGFRSLTSLFSALLCLAAVNTAVAADEEKITYDQHILPMFRQHCGSCHNANDQKGGLVLDSFTGVMSGGGSGDVVEPGEADASYLFMVVTHESEPVMPPGSKIPQKDIDLLKKWIDLGALENAGSKVMKKKESNLGQVEISTERPADAPVMPEGYSLNPQLVASRPNSVSAISASPWAPLVAVAGIKQILLYNTQTLDLIGVLPFPEGIAERLAFSRNGRVLMAGGGRAAANGLVVLWDVKTGNRISEIGAEYDSVLGADVSSDQTKVVLGGPKRMMRVYSIQTGELVYEKKKHTDWMMAAEFSPDSVLLATSDRSNGLLVWEAYTGNEYLSITGHSGSINDVSWRLDSNLLASGSTDSTIRLWELNDGKQVKRWNAHGGGVTSIEYTRDGRIVSTGRDKTARIWDGNGKELKRFNGLSAEGMAVTYDNESKRVIAGDRLGNVLIWQDDKSDPIGRLSANPPRIEDQLAQVAGQLKQAQDEINKLSAEKDSLNKQVAQKQNQVKDRKAKLASTQTQQKKTETEFAQAEAKRNEQNKVNEQLKSQNASLAKQIAGLGKTIDDLNKQQAQKGETQKQLQATEEQLKGLPAEDQQDEEQKNKAKQLTEKKKALTAQIAELDKQLANLPASQKKQQEQNKALAQVVEKQKAAQAAIKQFTDQANKLKASIGQLKKSVADLTKSVKEAEGSLKGFTDSTNKKLGEIGGKLNSFNQRKAHLESRHKLIQQQIQTKQQQASAS